jgi:aminodeoxyfutalosine deaminase
VILRAAWVVPVDGPPIRNGFVRIDGDRIAEVGAASARVPADDPSATTGETVDLGDAILAPGLVNPHTHLELTCYAGQIAPAPFWTWVMQLVGLRAAPGQVEREARGVYEGAWQSLRAGVTCVGDISRRNLHWRVLKTIPLRKVCFVELLTLADDPPRNLDELRAGVAAVEEDALLTAGLTPHAPYTVPAEQIAGTVALAAELGRPWCTHWAETREECAFLRGEANVAPFLAALLQQCGIRAPGLPPLEYLERCRAGRPAGALAHYNYADPDDAAGLAAAGYTVLYCPRAHRFFGHSAHPYRTFLAAGVRVALGTDSSASNWSLAPLEELRFLRRETPDAPAPDVLLRMLTLDAARALRLDERIGSLTAGKQADLAAWPCRAGVTDPVAHLADTAPAPVGVWVAGQRVI